MEFGAVDLLTDRSGSLDIFHYSVHVVNTYGIRGSLGAGAQGAVRTTRRRPTRDGRRGPNPHPELDLPRAPQPGRRVVNAPDGVGAVVSCADGAEYRSELVLGDAAHPMLQYLGQGACQALEDAHQIGAALGEHPGALDTALRQYESVRIERASRCQLSARPWGEVWHTDDPVTVGLRNRFMRGRAYDDYSDVDWLYADPCPAPTQNTPPRPTAAPTRSGATAAA